MDISQWLAAAQTALENSSTARLDALVLLEDCLAMDRAQVLAHPETKLTASQIKTLRSQLSRRAKHEPLAYIRGVTEFYGRDFLIDHRVLEPRPESETIIELLKGLALPAKPQIVDVGTGSGALAITAKLELPQAEVSAVDIDPGCLEVAQKNAHKHAVQVTFHLSNLLEQIHQPADVLLCNLPYVPDDFHINEAALHEPKLAIFGGASGLDLYLRLFEQIANAGFKPAHILTESLPTQHHALAELARRHSYIQTKKEDFIQLFEPA